MGFFTRKKKTAEAATTNIDTHIALENVTYDDYVAPNIDDIEAAAKEGEGNGELAVADGEGEGEGSSAVLSSAKEMTRQLSENFSTSLSNINVDVGKIQDDVYVNVSTAAGKIRTTVQDLTKPQIKEEVVAADENEEKGIVVVPPEITRPGVAGVQLCIVSGCTNRAQSVVVPPEIIPVNGEDFVKGTVQPPMYKDVKYTVLFLLHFVIMGWWFVDSFKLVSIRPYTVFLYLCLFA